MQNKCWCFKPGCGLFFLMFVIVKGSWVIVDSARAIIAIEPPPSK